MMHMNRYMDYPQSFQGTHFHYPYPYYPSWSPSQTKVETTKSPGMYEPWLYGNSCGFSNPAECHSCCNHGHPFGYYNWKPPHSHLPPPPPFYHHGPYSPYVDHHPPHYFPPHYAMEQPSFEIDKAMPKIHCCGCQNHSCHGKKDKGVRIEEHEPEFEKNESNPLGLTKVNRPSYPIVWIPSEYTNRGASKPSESDSKLLNGWFPIDMRNDKENSKRSDSVPMVWNGWPPFDVNSIRSLGQDGHKDREQNQHKEEREGQIPYPIVWMPAYDKPEEVEKIDSKESNPSPKGAEEPQKKYTIIPVRFPFNVNRGAVEGAVKDSSETGVQSKVKQNEVEDPVTQIEERTNKKTSEENKKEPKSVSVKQPEEQRDKKPSSNENARTRSPSPSKGTKLPPVCLRVEPLPRRKSRSPSPPSVKEKVVKEVDGTSKSPSPPKRQQDTVTQQPSHNIETEAKQQNKETKVVNVEERKSSQGKNQDPKNTDQVRVPIPVPVVSNMEVPMATPTEKPEMSGDISVVNEGAKEPREKNIAMKQKKNLSPAEAAVKIQSTYRGYEVRKWEPLKKLRQIAKVREQVNEVRKQILSLESSDMQINEKQRVFVSETIMNLLLQLDTIQGLLPSLRDIRKSVARELVSLQEKLDTLSSQKVEGPKSIEAEEEINLKPSTDNNVETTCMQAESLEESQDLELENPSMATDASCVPLVDKPEESAQQPLHAPGSELVETAAQPASESLECSVMQPTATYEVKDADTRPKEILETVQHNEDLENSKVHYSVLAEDETPDLASDELSASPVEEQGSYSDIIASDGAAMSVFPESPLILDKAVTEEVESKSEEFILPPSQEENAEEDLVEVMNHVEEAREVPKIGNADASSKSSELVDFGAASEEVIEVNGGKKEVGSNTPDLASDELSASPVEEKETYSDITASDGAAMSVAPESLDKVVTEEVESKSEEFILPLSQEEKAKEAPVEVSSPGEQLVEEMNHVEEAREVPKICNADASSKSSESVDSGAASEEVIEVTGGTKEDKSETFAAKNEVSKGEETSTGEDASGESFKEEREGTEDVEEPTVDKDETLGCSPGAEVLEVKVVGLAPESAQEEKGKGDTSLESEVSSRSVDQSEEKNNLVKENEKLRDMLEKLIKVGNDQLTVISDLNGRVKDLERKLTKKKKLRMRRPRQGAAKASY